MEKKEKEYLEKIPKELCEQFLKQGVNTDTLLFAASADMNRNGEYAQSYVLLSKKWLAVACSPVQPDRIHYFKGYGTGVEMQHAFSDWKSVFEGRQGYYLILPVEEIEKLYVETGVGCNLLTVLREGGEIPLVMFSNLHQKKFSVLGRALEQMKKGEEPEFKVEKEECCPKCGRMYPDSARKICPHCMDKTNIFFRVFGYFKPYRAKFIAMVVIIILGSLLNLVWPYLNGRILYDKILAKQQDFLPMLGLKEGQFVTALLMVVITMVVTQLVSLLLGILRGVMTAQMVVCVVKNMKKDVFRIMGKLSINFYRSRQTGSLMTRVMGDAERVTGFFVDGAPYLLVSSFTLIATIVVMLSINVQMTLLTLILLPILVTVTMKLQPKIWIMYGRRHRAERGVNGGVNDNLMGSRVVKSFGQEDREITRFQTNNKRLRDSEVAISYRQNSLRVTYGATQELVTMGIWALGVYFIMAGNGEMMNLGTLITFVGYVGQLQGPMNFFAQVFYWWADSMNSAQRMFEIIDAVPEIVESENPVSLKDPKGEIVFDNVSFGYEVNRPVLKDISLTIPAGSMIGIVGRSGAGKTTLVNLLSRMYDTKEGSIKIDGVDVKDLAFHDLRKNVAMVSQETYIFMGTVAENIAYANQDATLLDVMRAAKLAGAHEFIMRMPDGYDTKIGASGRELSGGERQRISIARAILANPKILILDEATASVDTETERIIQKSLGYLVKGRTTLSIAHRLSTLRDADYLIVIDQGRITEQGTHEELEALKGTYYKLMELQTKALAIKSETSF